MRRKVTVVVSVLFLAGAIHRSFPVSSSWRLIQLPKSYSGGRLLTYMFILVLTVTHRREHKVLKCVILLLLYCVCLFFFSILLLFFSSPHHHH